MSSAPSVSDVVVRVRGTVQGVGYRPFVHRAALSHGLRGWVHNDQDGVLLRVQGDPARVAALMDLLRNHAPPAARVLRVELSAPDARHRPIGEGFAIVASVSHGEATTPISPDLAMCADCRREFNDATNRRYHYPFINCTQCGPRYSLVENLPYDRPATTMRKFSLCPLCQREYEDTADRRFHAEPNACPDCGPHLTLCDATGKVVAKRASAVRVVRALLNEGVVVAVKGVGGFHLLCDATSELAVSTLRRRKHRAEKPLAVLFHSLAQLRRFAEVSSTAAATLLSPAAPIVLVPHLPPDASARKPRLAAGLAPGNPWIGAMLASNPLHVLLSEAVDFPLVATSANFSEEPICTDNDEARTRLALIADIFLEHDRPIAHPVDDSVLRFGDNDEPILLRRARGYAPAPFTLPGRLSEKLLCVGAQMKNTVAMAAEDQVVLSPHLGDLSNLVTHQAFERTIATLGQLQRGQFTAVAHDSHPDYGSTRYALRMGLPTVAVQHHLAHLLACVLENEHPADDVLGVVWDGTGYGEDGTVWGGEFIRLRKNRAERFARLRPFRLAGSEAAVSDARRIALGLAHEMGIFSAMAAHLALPDPDAATLQTMLSKAMNSPVCSSMGRLFDAFGVLLDLGRTNSFEGQLPLAVEAAAMTARTDQTQLPFPLRRPTTAGACHEIDWQPAVEQLLHRRGDTPSVQAAGIHRGLARSIVAVAEQADVSTVALTGGCFQNALLHSLASAALKSAGFRVLVHRHLPPNDNAIAAGQALAVLWRLTSVSLPS